MPTPPPAAGIGFGSLPLVAQPLPWPPSPATARQQLQLIGKATPLPTHPPAAAAAASAGPEAAGLSSGIPSEPTLYPTVSLDPNYGVPECSCGAGGEPHDAAPSEQPRALLVHSQPHVCGRDGGGSGGSSSGGAGDGGGSRIAFEGGVMAVLVAINRCVPLCGDALLCVAG